MAITLTESAAKHVASRLDKRGKGIGLRLGVRTSGCSGLAYKIEYADDVRPEDFSFESHGVKVLVDPKSLQFLDGTELDFAREGLNEGFKFIPMSRTSAAAASLLTSSKNSCAPIFDPVLAVARWR
jgi:iron-sulfur cluster assembly protein